MNANSEARLECLRIASDRKRRSGFTWIELLVVLAILAVLCALFIPFSRLGGVRNASLRSQCKNNLKQIGLALHNYHDTYKTFPPAYTVDAAGQPLHSWRTLILPFVDLQALYDKIDLSKPWDDPTNAEAVKTCPPVYRCPSSTAPSDQTTYLAIAGPDGCLSTTHPRPLSEITDGTSNTLMVVEVPMANAVPWMSPLDADEKLLLSFGEKTEWQHTGGLHGLLADGGVRFLSANLPPAIWKGLCTVAGHETIGEF